MNKPNIQTTKAEEAAKPPIKRAKIKSSIDGAKIQATEEIVKIIKPKTRGLVLP